MEQTNWSRRSFLQTSLIGACGVAGSSWGFAQGAGAGSSILDRTGVALYTVRDLMKDAAATLKAIADLGYKYVEGGLRPDMGPASSKPA